MFCSLTISIPVSVGSLRAAKRCFYSAQWPGRWRRCTAKHRTSTDRRERAEWSGVEWRGSVCHESSRLDKRRSSLISMLQQHSGVQYLTQHSTPRWRLSTVLPGYILCSFALHSQPIVTDQCSHAYKHQKCLTVCHRLHGSANQC